MSTKNTPPLTSPTETGPSRRRFLGLGLGISGLIGTAAIGGCSLNQFCAPTNGVKNHVKDKHGKPTHKAAPLKRLKCGS